MFPPSFPTILSRATMILPSIRSLILKGELKYSHQTERRSPCISHAQCRLQVSLTQTGATAVAYLATYQPITMDFSPQGIFPPFWSTPFRSKFAIYTLEVNSSNFCIFEKIFILLLFLKGIFACYSIWSCQLFLFSTLELSLYSGCHFCYWEFGMLSFCL